MPEDLEELLRDRIRRLPDATRSALLACSAASRPTLDLIRAAQDSSDDPLGPAEEAGIVTVEGSRIAFTHPLLALAVYRGAPSGQRRAAHRRLAEVVPDVEERARHLALASSEPDGRLAEVLDQAARRAHDRGAPGAAAELAELAGRSTPPADLESRWRRGMEEAGFRFEAGDTGAARRLTQELRSAASPGSQRAEISHLMANLLWNDVNEIRGLLESVLAEASGDAALAAAHADMGVVELLGGHMRSGSQHGRRAIALAERGDAPDALSLALVGTAYTEFLLGIDTVALLSRAAEVERRIAGRRSVSYVMTNAENLFGAEVLGAQLMWSGDIAGGRRVLERNYRDLVDRGQYTILWDCLVFLSELETRAGAFVRALEYAEEILEILDEAGYDKAREVGLWARSLAEAHLGLVDQARRDATEGLDACRAARGPVPRDHELLGPRLPRALPRRLRGLEPTAGTASRAPRLPGHRRARCVSVRTRLRRGARRHRTPRTGGGGVGALRTMGDRARSAARVATAARCRGSLPPPGTRARRSSTWDPPWNSTDGWSNRSSWRGRSSCSAPCSGGEG